MGKAKEAEVRTMALENGDKLLTPREAADILHMSRNAFYLKCYKGEGPKHVVRLGRRKLYKMSDVQRLIADATEVEGEG